MRVAAPGIDRLGGVLDKLYYFGKHLARISTQLH